MTYEEKAEEYVDSWFDWDSPSPNSHANQH